MDAISFGFAATAILISLFLLMAIFEHLIKPRAFPPDPDSPDGRRPHAAVRHRRHGRRSPGKLRGPPIVRSAKLAWQSPVVACHELHCSACYLLGGTAIRYPLALPHWV
jgi:hypothetical protein